MKQPTLFHPSWGQIDKACALLANQIIRYEGGEEPPTVVVGLARGGLVPAIIISHILEIPMIPVSYSSQRGNGEYKQYANVLPEIPFNNILVVDDIVDSGYTMKEIVEYYGEDHYVRAAALYYKEGAQIRPTFAWQTIPADSQWIVFPWEI